MQAGTFSVCSRRQNSRPVQAGTFPLFVLLVKGTGVYKLYCLFVLLVRGTGACKLYFLFVLLVRGTGACKLVLSLCSRRQKYRPVQAGIFSLFCSSKAQVRASWYFLCLFSLSKLQTSASWYFLCLCSACQRYRHVQADTFSVFVLLVKGTCSCKPLVLSSSLFSSSKP